MKLNLPQASFNGGFLDSSLSARIDLAKYGAGCKEITNFIPLPAGGVYRRPGSRCIMRFALTDKYTRLIPFQFNVEQTYSVLFADNKIYFFNDRDLTGEALTVPVVASPYAPSEVNDIHYAQSADVLYLSHPNHAPRRLERLTAISFQLVTIDFVNSTQSPPTVFSAVWSGAGGTVNMKYAIVAVSADGEESDVVYDSSILNGRDYRFWIEDNYVTLSWTAPVGGADKYIVYKEKNGVYGYIGTIRGATTFRDDNFTPDMNDSVPVTNNPFSGAGEYPATVTLHQQRVYYGGSNNKPMTIWASRSGVFSSMRYSDIPREDDSFELTLFSKQINAIQWFAASGGDILVGTPGAEWRISSVDDGVITPTTAVNRKQSNWGSKNLIPIIVGNSILYVERRGSKIHDLVYNDQVKGYAGTDLSVLAQSLFEGYDVISWAYQRSPESVVWCVRSDGILLGLTYIRDQQIFAWHVHDMGGEVQSVAVIAGEKYDDVYLTIKRETGKINVEVLEDKWDGQNIMDAFFLDGLIKFDGSYVNDRYLWNLSGSGTNEYYVTDPDGNYPWPTWDIYAFRGGSPMFYDGPLNIYALDTELTRGAKGSLAVGEWDYADDVGLGFYTLYVRLPDETNPGSKEDDYVREMPPYISTENYHYEDGFLTPFFENDEVVTAIINGKIFYDQVIENHRFTCPVQGFKIAIGFQYTSKVAPMGIEISGQQGSSLGKQKSISAVTLRFKDTVGGKIGPDEDYLDDLNFSPDEYGAAIPPFSGDYYTTFPADYRGDGSFYVIQDQPLPMTVLALIPEIDISED